MDGERHANELTNYIEAGRPNANMHRIYFMVFIIHGLLVPIVVAALEHDLISKVRGKNSISCETVIEIVVSLLVLPWVYLTATRTTYSGRSMVVLNKAKL